MLNKEEVTVENRTNRKMRVTLVTEVEYATYEVSTNGRVRYDDYNFPKKRKIKVLLDEVEGGDA